MSKKAVAQHNTPLPLKYVKWTSSDEVPVVHVGVVTKEDDNSLTFLTKYGEMTIQKTDDQFESSTREEFEQVVVPVKEVPVTGETKMAKATKIYLEMTSDPKVTHRRIDIIHRFMNELHISQPHASTYHQSIKVKQQQQQQPQKG